MNFNGSNSSSCHCPGLFVYSLINTSIIPCEDDKQNSFFFHTNSSFMEPDSNVTFCNCSQFGQDTEQASAVAIIRIITSIISIIGSASIILSVLLSGKLNRSEVHPLFILSVGDFILSILWFIGGIIWLNPGEGGWANENSDAHSGMCYVLGMATSMAAMVTFLLTLVYAVNALLRVIEVYMNRGKVLIERDVRKRVRHVFILVGYVVSWTLPLIILIPAMEVGVGIESTNKGCWCVLDFFNLRPDDGLSTKYSSFRNYPTIHANVLGISLILITTAIFGCYIATLLFSRQVIQQQDKMMLEENTMRSRQMMRSISIRLTAFVIIFLISGLPIFAACIDVWRESDSLHLNEIEDRFIYYSHALFAPLQGILNAVVYGWSRKEFRKAISCKERMKSIIGDNGGYDSLNAKSRHPTDSRFSSSRNMHM